MKQNIFGTVFLGFIFILSSNAQEFNEMEKVMDDLEKNSTNTKTEQKVVDTTYESNAVTTAACRLYSDIGNLSSVITIIPDGEKIFIKDIIDDFYYIKFNDNQGFVSKEKVKPDKSFLNKSMGVSQESTKSDPEKLKSLQKKYGHEIAQKIMDHKIWRNMTANMVEESWGRPDKINRYIKTGHLREEWLYPSTYLLFINKKLVDWGPLK